VFLRLYLSKTARQLINMQRHTTVIDVFKQKKQQMINNELPSLELAASSSSDNECMMHFEKEAKLLNRIQN